MRELPWESVSSNSFSLCNTNRRDGVHFQWTNRNRTKKGRGPKNRTKHLAEVHSQRAPTQKKNRASRRGRRPENRLDCCPGLRVLFPCPALGSAFSRLPDPLSGHSLCSWSWVTPSVLVSDDSRTDPFLKFRRDGNPVGDASTLEGAPILQPINKERAPTQEPALQILGEMSRRALQVPAVSWSLCSVSALLWLAAPVSPATTWSRVQGSHPILACSRVRSSDDPRTALGALPSAYCGTKTTAAPTRITMCRSLENLRISVSVGTCASHLGLLRQTSTIASKPP